MHTGAQCVASFVRLLLQNLWMVNSASSSVMMTEPCMLPEWTRIEPEEGQIDAKAVARYHAILDCLLR